MLTRLPTMFLTIASTSATVVDTRIITSARA